MANMVDSFNQLNRPEKSPSGLVPNHWYFAIRHLPFSPVGDVVQLVQLDSNFLSCAGPQTILSLPNFAAQADVIVPMLLETFVKGLDHGSRGDSDPQFPPFAPWSWGTSNANLAHAVEIKLRALGVRADLCKVEPGTKEHDKVSDDCWKRLMSQLMESTRQPLPIIASPGRVICDGCKQDSSWFSTGLLKCARCSARYCSHECQKNDWKQHKNICGKHDETLTGQQPFPKAVSVLDCLNYYHKRAHTVPEAKALADSINLPLPPLGGGLSIPIRRLVIVGKDTPANLELLIGPKWQAQIDFWSDTRIEVLLDPPRGSPSYAFHHGSHATDVGMASTPRPASAKETAKIKKVREIQQAVRTRLGSRVDPTTQDMEAILKACGPDWGEMLPLYQLAVNTMDRGVQVR